MFSSAIVIVIVLSSRSIDSFLLVLVGAEADTSTGRALNVVGEMDEDNDVISIVFQQSHYSSSLR